MKKAKKGNAAFLSSVTAEAKRKQKLLPLVAALYL
jgi:hypothetical protein